MSLYEIIDQVVALLQKRRRVTYRSLKYEFQLDDEGLEALKEELIEVLEVAVDKDGKMLVWTGSDTSEDTSSQTADAPATELSSSVPPAQPEREAPAGERRQLTVMFCDLVGSTALSEQLDPEELREIVRAYQEACAGVITHFAGHIAKYLGDGLLVYFGYPVAHEDDATRAVRAGLDLVEAVQGLNASFSQPLQVRVGIHTGLVVAGEMGTPDQPEHLAIVGETPNIAARVQGKAEPDSVVISPATFRLVEGLFACRDLGPQELKGISTAQSLYQVQGESEAHSRFEVAVRTGLTPLVGRSQELGLLGARWEQASAGDGQVVLLSGEAGIGKSRLVQTLKEQVIQAGATRIEFRCSPYHQNTALYPLTERLQRLLQFESADTPQTKLAKLAQVLSQYRFPQAETFPLLAALLSLPPPEGVAPLGFSPQKQKRLTLVAVVAWLVEEAERATVYCAFEDLHWADPSTVELLELLVDQVPTTRLLVLLTFRPEFRPPWSVRSSMTPLTLSRLGRREIETMIEQVTGGKALPAEVIEQVVAKTDGVPIFVEELTKMVVESDLVTAVNGHYELTGPLPALAIPSTLHDSLMARLDRLAEVKEVAQLGATLGREFSYELLQAVSPLEEAILEQGLRQLMEAELVLRRGLPPQVQYVFKHALVRDTAYQSLLKRTRQQYHEQIARVLERQFPDTPQTQPELLAHHYTEAGLAEQAIPYWQQAGQRAVERSAYVEATHQLRRGLEVLSAVSDATLRVELELTLQVTLGAALMATHGYAAGEVGQAYTRALTLSREVGGTPHHVQALGGLWQYYLVRGDLQQARELAEELLGIARSLDDPFRLLGAYRSLGEVLFFTGNFPAACDHLEAGVALYDPLTYQSQPALFGNEPLVFCRAFVAFTFWTLGYPDQARARMEETLALARELAHPLGLAACLLFAVWISHYRRESQTVGERADEAVALAIEQGFPFWLAVVKPFRGWALVEQGQAEAGLAILGHSVADYETGGAKLSETHILALLAEGQQKVGQIDAAFASLARALDMANATGERYYEAELHRLKGELTLQAGDAEEAEACFQQALVIAQRQEAKSWELRAATSLARLWQSQGKQAEARDLLAPVYDWFTEGFDTVDLEDAKALLNQLP